MHVPLGTFFIFKNKGYKNIFGKYLRVGIMVFYFSEIKVNHILKFIYLCISNVILKSTMFLIYSVLVF